MRMTTAFNDAEAITIGVDKNNIAIFEATW